MVVDNTVATGLLQRPLDFGAVASLYSLTKSAAGHSDLIMGAVLTRDPGLLAELRGWRTLGGGIAGPMESWLALRSLKTLPLRIERQSATALRLAGYLAGHPRVTAVHYPGTCAPTLAVASRADASGGQQCCSFDGLRRRGRGRRHRGGPADRPRDQFRRRGRPPGSGGPAGPARRRRSH